MRGAHRSTQSAAGWTQKSLVVAQAALSLVLLCAAGLLTQSLRNMHHQNFGFDVANRYIVHFDPQMAGFTSQQLPAFYRQLHDNLASIPGVQRVSFALYTPMEGNNWGESVYIEGQAPPPPGDNQNGASWLRVSDGYFESIGTRIIKGRSITEQDTAASRNVAVINETFAKKLLKDQDPSANISAIWIRGMQDRSKSSELPRTRSTGTPPTRFGQCSFSPKLSKSGL